MPGAGTNPGIMTAEPPVRLLDVTRLVSRVGLGPMTGIDRVEAAYLRALNSAAQPLFLLCRTGYGYLLLPGSAGSALIDWLANPETLPQASWLDRLRRKVTPRRRLEAGLRGLAWARAPHAQLTAMLRRRLPPGSAYLNVGQATIAPATLGALKRVPGLRVAVMIHDTIPLDHPQFSRQGEPARFAAKLAATLHHADLILCNSQVTADDLARHATGGPLPRCLVAHLGTEPQQPDWAALPPGLDLSAPYFVTLGTIEPRKNHTLLLDAWEDILRRVPETAAPRLLIVGRRGWNNAATFARLDSAPYMGRVVHELSGLSDGAVAALLARAQALLMPSHVEGFGLPMTEAAALGVPVLAAPLPVARELLGDAAIYADTDASGAWAEKIIALAHVKRSGPAALRTFPSQIVIPTWTDHFNLVLKET